jgi:hypothetical protein
MYGLSKREGSEIFSWTMRFGNIVVSKPALSSFASFVRGNINDRAGEHLAHITFNRIV